MRELDSLTQTELEPWMKLSTEGSDVPVGRIEEFRIPGDGYETEGRIYYPEGSGTFPVMFFIHGGAFVGGFNLMDEPVCRQICRDAGCAVISPNYQLAPQHKWPAAIDELYSLLLYFQREAGRYYLDMDRLAIGGSSAGANYAAALCVKSFQENGPQFRYQVLIYPVTDLRADTSGKVNGLTVMGDEKPNDLYLSLIENYIPEGADNLNPLISPLYAPAEAFPKTAIFSGRQDLLWWDGKALADKLIDAGVETIYKCYTGIGHGFMELAGGEHVSRDVRNLICSELRRNL